MNFTQAKIHLLLEALRDFEPCDAYIRSSSYSEIDKLVKETKKELTEEFKKLKGESGK